MMGTEYSMRMENMVDGLRARVRELEHRDICSHCGAPATCMGAYEDERNIGFGCDNCCGHDNEDGWCVPIEEAGEKLIALRIVGIKAEAERDAALAQVERLRGWLEYINSDTYSDRHLNDSADALEGKPAPSPAPELWPCGHEKARHDEVCGECSP